MKIKINLKLDMAALPVNTFESKFIDIPDGKLIGKSNEEIECMLCQYAARAAEEICVSNIKDYLVIKDQENEYS
jgi:hypothetical protein